MGISGYYANPLCALSLVASDYTVVGAHLRSRIRNVAPEFRVAR